MGGGEKKAERGGEKMRDEDWLCPLYVLLTCHGELTGTSAKLLEFTSPPIVGHSSPNLYKLQPILILAGLPLECVFAVYETLIINW